jgi:IS5 family transposase
LLHANEISFKLGLAILKHSYDLSDEGLCERWVENPSYQV